MPGVRAPGRAALRRHRAHGGAAARDGARVRGAGGLRGAPARHHRALRGARDAGAPPQLGGRRGGRAEGGRHLVPGQQPEGAEEVPVPVGDGAAPRSATQALHRQPAVDAQGRGGGAEDPRGLRRSSAPPHAAAGPGHPGLQQGYRPHLPHGHSAEPRGRGQPLSPTHRPGRHVGSGGGAGAALRHRAEIRGRRGGRLPKGREDGTGGGPWGGVRAFARHWGGCGEGWRGREGGSGREPGGAGLVRKRPRETAAREAAQALSGFGEGRSSGEPPLSLKDPFTGMFGDSLSGHVEMKTDFPEQTRTHSRVERSELREDRFRNPVPNSCLLAHLKTKPTGPDISWHLPFRVITGLNSRLEICADLVCAGPSLWDW